MGPIDWMPPHQHRSPAAGQTGDRCSSAPACRHRGRPACRGGVAGRCVAGSTPKWWVNLWPSSRMTWQGSRGQHLILSVPAGVQYSRARTFRTAPPAPISAACSSTRHTAAQPGGKQQKLVWGEATALVSWSAGQLVSLRLPQAPGKELSCTAEQAATCSLYCPASWWPARAAAGASTQRNALPGNLGRGCLPACAACMPAHARLLWS